MVRRFSEWLLGLSTGPLALVALVAFLLFGALVLPGQSRLAAETAGGAGSPDTYFYYGAAALYGWAEAYGTEGRQAYVRARFTFDLVFPVVYSVFLATALSWSLWMTAPRRSAWRRANLLPFVGALFDYLENVSAALVMGRYPATTPVLDHLAGLFTALKWLCLGASFIVLLAALAAALRKRLRRW
jgi:hypothetical protein